MLTLDRSTRIKITDVDALDAGRDRPARLSAVRATEIVCQIVFIYDGFFHADPHPSDLFVEPDRRVALINFGMVGEIGDELRQLAAMLVAVAQEDTDLMVGAVVALDVNGTGVDRQALRADLDSLLTGCLELWIGEIAIRPSSSVCWTSCAPPHRHAHQMILLLKMLVMVEELGVRLDPASRWEKSFRHLPRDWWQQYGLQSKLARRLAGSSLTPSTSSCQSGVAEAPDRGGRSSASATSSVKATTYTRTVP